MPSTYPIVQPQKHFRFCLEKDIKLNMTLKKKYFAAIL